MSKFTPEALFQHGTTSSIPDEMWRGRGGDAIKRQAAAAEFWQDLSRPEEGVVDSEHDDPEPEYDDKEASFQKAANEWGPERYDRLSEMSSEHNKIPRPPVKGKDAYRKPGEGAVVGAGLGMMPSAVAGHMIKDPTPRQSAAGMATFLGGAALGGTLGYARSKRLKRKATEKFTAEKADWDKKHKARYDASKAKLDKEYDDLYSAGKEEDYYDHQDRKAYEQLHKAASLYESRKK
jgi:hypothetical protein